MDSANDDQPGTPAAPSGRYPETLMPIAGDHVGDVASSFADLREEVLLDYSYNTARAYWADLQDVYDWAVARGLDPLELTDKQLKQYVALLRRRRYSENTIRRRLVSYRKITQLHQEPSGSCGD